MTNNQRKQLTLSLKDKNLEADQNTKFSTSLIDVSTLKNILTSKNYSSIIWRNNRQSSEFQCATAASIDIDHGTTIQEAETILKKHNLNYALITSKSHTPAAHRFRIILPFTRSIFSVENYSVVMSAIRTDLFPTIDPNTLDAARFFFYSPETAYYSSKWDGKDYDPDQNTGNEIPNAWNDHLIVTDNKKQQMHAILVDDKIPVYCPFHEDSNSSAFVKRQDNGKQFIRCSTCGKTFWKVEPPFEKRCERFWSHSTEIYEFVIAGESFSMSPIGKEKFSLFVDAISSKERQDAMKYLVDNKHIPHLKLIEHISDPSLERSVYGVDTRNGIVIVRYAPRPVVLSDNPFIEEYLEKTFGTYKEFIKQWLAVYCYSNHKDLPTLILKGPRCTGKNTFAEMIYSIFPSISIMWDAQRKNFTPEAEKKLLIADESASADPEQYKLLKEYAGQKFVHVNKKYLPPYDVPNNMNIILLSNSAIPVFLSRDELPTSDQNNQFFVYEFRPFSGPIDPDLDKKLEDRIGHYVRTELKTVFDNIDFTGNRYSIRVPITPEESGIFVSNITEAEGVADRMVDKVIMHKNNIDSPYKEFLDDGWLPIDIINDSTSASRMGAQKVIKTLKEQKYLEMKDAEKKQYNKIRCRCYQMTDKLKNLK